VATTCIKLLGTISFSTLAVSTRQSFLGLLVSAFVLLISINLRLWPIFLVDLSLYLLIHEHLTKGEQINLLECLGINHLMIVLVLINDDVLCF
jgi:hypothetical protein